MTQPATEILKDVEFQLSLLQLGLLGADTPQAEALAALLRSPFSNTTGVTR